MQLCTCSIFISSSFHFILESLIDNKLQQQQQQQRKKKKKNQKSNIYEKRKLATIIFPFFGKFFKYSTKKECII